MRKKLLLLSVLVTVFALPSRAQVTTLTAHVISATVDGQQDGATGISTDAAVDVSFTFDQALPSASDADALFEYIGEFAGGSEPTLSTDKKTITFSVQHNADTDYYWIVSGSVFTDTTLNNVIQAAPYVLAYTTSDGSGRFSVSGTVDVSSGAGKNLVEHRPVMLHGLHRASSLSRSASRSGQAALKAKTTASSSVLTRTLAHTSLAAAEAEGSVVLLLQADNPNPDVEGGQLVGAAVAGADGSYTVDFAQAGTYYAIGQNVAGLDIADLSGLFGAFLDLHLGSYDTDSDGAPDDVTVAASDVSGIDITMYPASNFAVTSVDADADARTFVEDFTGGTDVQLTEITAIGDGANGDASFWQFTYLYTDPESSESMRLDVTRQAFLIFAEDTPSLASGDEVPLPEDYLTTPDLMTTVSGDADVAAFLTAHAATPKLVWLSLAGDLLEIDPVALLNSDKTLWRAAIISYGDVTSLFGNDAAVAYVDIAGGDPVAVQLFPALPTDYQETAQNAATLLAGGGDAKLYRISSSPLDFLSALFGGGGFVGIEGKSATWSYTFTSSMEFPTVVSLGGFFSAASPNALDTTPEDPVFVPETYASTTDILTASEANGGRNFRNGHTDDVYISIEGGDAINLRADRPGILDDHPEVATTPVWAITYAEFQGLGETEVDSLVYVYDMVTGDLITRVGVATGSEQEGELPSVASLKASYPNPFRAQAHIPFALPSAQHVTLKVYNVLGQEVATLVDAVVPAGNQSVTWNATAVPSGVYFVRMKSEGATQSQKLVVQH